MAMKRTVKNTVSLWRMFTKIADELGETFEKPQLVTVEDYKPPRSLTQNAKLHVMIRTLADKVGYSESELKDWFKHEFGPQKRLEFEGKWGVGQRVKVIPKSTTEYTREEMAQMIEHVDRICAENGVYVETEG